jgi:hypothetical protein
LKPLENIGSDAYCGGTLACLEDKLRWRRKKVLGHHLTRAYRFRDLLWGVLMLITTMLRQVEWLNVKLVTELGRKYDRYLSSERLAEISGSSGLSVPVVLGILQHAGIIDWRRFAPYREPALNMIPAIHIKG